MELQEILEAVEWITVLGIMFDLFDAAILRGIVARSVLCYSIVVFRDQKNENNVESEAWWMDVSSKTFRSIYEPAHESVYL